MSRRKHTVDQVIDALISDDDLRALSVDIPVEMLRRRLHVRNGDWDRFVADVAGAEVYGEFTFYGSAKVKWPDGCFWSNA